MRPVRYRDKYGVNQTATLDVRDGVVFLELPRPDRVQPPRAALSTGERGVQGRPEDPRRQGREGREAVAVTWMAQCVGGPLDGTYHCVMGGELRYPGWSRPAAFTACLPVPPLVHLRHGEAC
jgi:hypothetical protein